MTFFLAMMLFPDVQVKAQEELDRVLGGDLPLVRTARNYRIWAVVGDASLAPSCTNGYSHASTNEDSVRGYRIPKGALVLPNTGGSLMIQPSTPTNGVSAREIHHTP